jgi:hypothetical protein
MMAVGPRPDDGHDKEFMNTLVKELAVLSAFGKQRPQWFAYRTNLCGYLGD